MVWCGGSGGLGAVVRAVVVVARSMLSAKERESRGGLGAFVMAAKRRHWSANAVAGGPRGESELEPGDAPQHEARAPNAERRCDVSSRPGPWRFRGCGKGVTAEAPGGVRWAHLSPASDIVLVVRSSPPLGECSRCGGGGVKGGSSYEWGFELSQQNEGSLGSGEEVDEDGGEVQVKEKRENRGDAHVRNARLGDLAARTILSSDRRSSNKAARARRIAALPAGGVQKLDGAAHPRDAMAEGGVSLARHQA